MSNLIKNILSKGWVSRIFWKNRHVFQPEFLKYLKSIQDDYRSKSSYFNELISKYMDQNEILVLELGCSSGSALYGIKEKTNASVFGIDINRKAIEFCIRNFSERYEEGFYFTNKYDEEEILRFINDNNRKEFDLVIFDRVLYCLEDDEIVNLFKSICNLTNYIYVDDFFYSDNLKTSTYKHRKWDELLAKYKFISILDNKSMYSASEVVFSRSRLYKKAK